MWIVNQIILGGTSPSLTTWNEDHSMLYHDQCSAVRTEVESINVFYTRRQKNMMNSRY